VTPTILVLTFFNPMGALLGFRRSGQWNLDFAAPVCAGGLVGGVIGPFARATVLAEPENFRITLGIALALCGLQLCYRALADYARSRPGMGLRFFGRPDTSVSEQTPAPFRIETTFRSLFRIGIRYDSGMRELSNLHLFVTGLAVGIFSSALGVGGGFLLVPIFALVWRLPIYVMVAASIPYAVVLSLAGIITFMFVLPLVGAPPIDPEWSWGLFCRRRRRPWIMVRFKDPGLCRRAASSIVSWCGDGSCWPVLCLKCSRSPVSAHMPRRNQRGHREHDVRHVSQNKTDNASTVPTCRS
jgi:uncharacterized membrane protein YfcA